MKYTNLIDTVGLMSSDDYKERMESEYYQLLIRIGKLNRIITSAEYIMYNPPVKKVTLMFQLLVMNIYAKILKKRLEQENVTVD